MKFLKKKKKIWLKLRHIPDNELIKGKITFVNLSFSYPSRPNEEVLNNINLIIPENKMVAIVGSSGAGKSTIASLMLRLHEPTSGDIIFDNRNSRDFSLSSLRSQIALVPQDVFLFGGSIRENISYGKPGSTEEEILECSSKGKCNGIYQPVSGKARYHSR